MTTPSEKFPKSSLFGGTIFLLFSVWLFFAGRSAATRGDVISTEFGAGWITPSTAYIVAALCFCIAVYLFIGYTLHHIHRRS